MEIAGGLYVDCVYDHGEKRHATLPVVSSSCDTHLKPNEVKTYPHKAVFGEVDSQDEDLSLCVSRLFLLL